MGFCDYLSFEKEYPEHGISKKTLCQTKSLYAGGAEFTITTDGKLVEHLYRYEDDPGRVHPVTRMPRWKRIAIGQKEIAYHGDIFIHCDGPELIARFTHGRLEWIRSVDEYPEENRALLREQGSR
jgi:hypothetical protein